MLVSQNSLLSISSVRHCWFCFTVMYLALLANFIAMLKFLGLCQNSCGLQSCFSSRIYPTEIYPWTWRLGESLCLCWTHGQSDAGEPTAGPGWPLPIRRILPTGVGIFCAGAPRHKEQCKSWCPGSAEREGPSAYFLCIPPASTPKPQPKRLPLSAHESDQLRLQNSQEHVSGLATSKQGLLRSTWWEAGWVQKAPRKRRGPAGCGWASFSAPLIFLFFGFVKMGNVLIFSLQVIGNFYSS